MAETNVADRLKLFIEMKGLTYAQFADMCGIPRPSLSQLLTGRNKKISDVMVGQIHNMFPELSIVWLLFGEGPLLDPNKMKSANSNEETPREYADGFFSFENTEPADAKKIVFSTDGKSEDENSKETGLNRASEILHHVEYKAEKLQGKIKELQSQIELMKKNPRKVVQITVYYDDNTFETFFPR